jgi:flavin-dependent dehydrogenase
VGGGPAVAATAALLRRAGVPTLVIERGSHPDRSSADILPSEVQLQLKELGLWSRFRRAPRMSCHAIRSAWGQDAPADRDFIRNPYGAGWCVRRSSFDRLLVDAARRAGAAVLTEAVPRHLSKERGWWRLIVDTPRRTSAILSRVLVDASGPGASVARMLSVRRLVHDRLVGLTRLYPAAHARDALDPVLLLESRPSGWWYSAPVDARTLFVAFVTDGALARVGPGGRERLWSDALADTSHTRARLEGAGVPTRLGVRSVPIARLERASGAGWLAVGDAASTLDPLSGAGIRKALADAQRASRTILSALRGATDAMREYGDAVGRGFEQHVMQRAAYYSLEQRWTDLPFWTNRFARTENTVL